MGKALLYHPISLSDRTIPGNIFLAPMAGFTDSAFRRIAVRCGADLAYSEMVSCEGIIRGNQKTIRYMVPSAREGPLAVQLFTGDPDSARQAVPLVLKHNPFLIDLNCGCPVSKVIKRGAGSALMREPERIFRIVAKMVEVSPVPITVKLRSGWDRNELTYLEAGIAAQAAGAEMVCLHPRSRSQGYAGTADYTHILRLKEQLSIPVLGSGDLFRPADIQRMLTATGCDGVMIARGAVGNPSLFSAVKKVLQHGDAPAGPGPERRLRTALEHLQLAVEDTDGNLTAAYQGMKRHLCAYCKGFENAAALREKIVHAASGKEIEAVIRLLKKNLHKSTPPHLVC